MLVFLAVLSLASAASLHDNRLQILHSDVLRLDGLQPQLQQIQLLRNPIQAVHSLGNSAQHMTQELIPGRQQYSILSFQPQIQPSLQSILPHQRELILTSGHPNIHEQYSIKTILDDGQQLPLISAQHKNPQIIFLNSPNQRNHHILNLKSDHQRNAMQNLRIHSNVQPLQYSNILEPKHPAFDLRSSVGLGEIRPVGNGGQISSYFLRGPDLENQGLVEQISQVRHPHHPPHYKLLSSLEFPRIRSEGAHPLRQINIEQVLQPPVKLIYTNH